MAAVFVVTKKGIKENPTFLGRKKDGVTVVRRKGLEPQVLILLHHRYKGTKARTYLLGMTIPKAKRLVDALQIQLEAFTNG